MVMENPKIEEKPKNKAEKSHENLTVAQKKLLLEALCEEKEGYYKEARDHFIELDQTEDALRCSGLIRNEKLLHSGENRLDNWRKENRSPIIALMVISGVAMIAFLLFLNLLNTKQRGITSPAVAWLNPGKVELTIYPNWFLYDKNLKQIRTRAVIDEKMKMELMKTYPLRGDSANFAEFRQSVEQLAFQSAEMKGSYYWLLLLVSGLAAIVGVFIREMLDLIRHFCYKKDLDFKLWWPWYSLRPIVGFMFGVMVILFNGTDLLFESANNSGETYLIAIAIIAGISVEDVMLKIRKVSQVLFGNNYKESDSVDGSVEVHGENDQSNKDGKPENKKDKQ